MFYGQSHTSVVKGRRRASRTNYETYIHQNPDKGTFRLSSIENGGLGLDIRQKGSGFINSENIKQTRHLDFTLDMVTYKVFSFNPKSTSMHVE